MNQMYLYEVNLYSKSDITQRLGDWQEAKENIQPIIASTVKKKKNRTYNIFYCYLDRENV